MEAARTLNPPPAPLETLIDRFDATRIDVPGGRARIRLGINDGADWDVVINYGRATIEPASSVRPDATLRANEAIWRRIADDVRGGMEAYSQGRLRVRHNLHLGVGLLAATAGDARPDGLRFARVRTEVGDISYIEAGSGEPLIALHGLGGTKASFLPTLSALADDYRVIALDLPGFGESVMPIGAAYDAPFFAHAVGGFMDAVGVGRAHLVGNSMGGRVSLELGMLNPDRIGATVLLCPALAWLTDRRWAMPLKLLRPELGLVQLAPRPIVEGIVRRLIPGANDGWAAAGVDEFLRAYLKPRGRAAFYASARNIYLDEPNGESGFWSRLGKLESDSLFLWGKHDQLVPAAFQHHVERALPAAKHVLLDCGHVPQVEAPGPTHEAMRKFLSARPLD
jgi:pimeloyl-ACP methyl ester carboxylesterase